MPSAAVRMAYRFSCFLFFVNFFDRRLLAVGLTGRCCMSSRFPNQTRFTASWPPAIGFALRPHYWAKNLLVALPLVAAQRAHEPALLRSVALAMVAMCCVASLGYLVNDWCDREDDRRHPLKSQRPLIGVALPIGWLFLLVLTLGMLLGLCVWQLPAPVMIALVVYFVVSLLYSWRLKHLFLVDVALLVLLFELRLWVGALAVALPVSPWLLAFSFGFFLNLALLKRVAALAALSPLGCEAEPGRPYRLSHQPFLHRCGRFAGVLALLVLFAYLGSAKAAALYTQPWLLMPVVALLAFWLWRLWRLADAGKIAMDPVQFALRDWLSYGLLILIGFFWWLAR